MLGHDIRALTPWAAGRHVLVEVEVEAMSIGWALLAIALVVIVWVAGTYNYLVRTLQRANEALADIDVQLQRRRDLIPNLVETIKGYAAHEKAIFQSVTMARSAAMHAATMTEKGQAENALSGTLKSLFAVAEAYPGLKANQNFLELQNQLAVTEDTIQAARRFYNGTVRDLNAAIQMFPTSVIAGQAGFHAMEFFHLGQPGQAAPEATRF